jgi:carboxylesterase type B
LAQQVTGYWTGFAEGGDPNAGREALWPSYDEQTDPELVLDLDTHAQAGQRAERCKLWMDVRAALWGDDWKID